MNMKTFLHNILLTVILPAAMAIIAPDCHAARLAQPTDSLLRQLHKATTAADSLPTLLHLYDAADRAGDPASTISYTPWHNEPEHQKACNSTYSGR